uniref:Uncharacterized protein n=1 Tax=Caenorhabditis japonica TaxID=281687 RepID=A0A8R1IJU1_CAEJA
MKFLAFYQLALDANNFNRNQHRNQQPNKKTR